MILYTIYHTHKTLLCEQLRRKSLNVAFDVIGFPGSYGHSAFAEEEAHGTYIQFAFISQQELKVGSNHILNPFSARL